MHKWPPKRQNQEGLNHSRTIRCLRRSNDVRRYQPVQNPDGERCGIQIDGGALESNKRYGPCNIEYTDHCRDAVINRGKASRIAKLFSVQGDYAGLYEVEGEGDKCHPEESEQEDHPPSVGLSCLFHTYLLTVIAPVLAPNFYGAAMSSPAACPA